MSHYAYVRDGIVQDVIVAEQDFVDWLSQSGLRHAVGIGQWIQTSYNTYGNTHKLGGTPLRKNFAGIGYTYREDLDAFVPPRPYEDWILDEETCLWQAPTPCPMDGKMYDWDSYNHVWVEKEWPL